MRAYRGSFEGRKKWVVARTIAAAGLAAALLSGCGTMAMRHGRADRPAASDFGPGPRASARGAYVATLQASAPLRARKMQTVELLLRGADGAPVDGATITIDGGMPEHGHGLPTQPRVTQSLGGGAYRVEGLKFNMGGWWELRFRIRSAAGADSVTFNLDL